MPDSQRMAAPKHPWSIAARRSQSFVVEYWAAIACGMAACFAVAYVTEFHRHVIIEQLSGDAIGGALPRWLRGENFYALTHHNFSQAHVQVFFMLADIYGGPYPWWSRLFDVAAWILFFTALRRVAPAPRGDVIAAIGIMMWFCFMNYASLFTYPWAQVEVSCQLLGLVGIFYAGRVWGDAESRHTGLTMLLLGLWIFVFSHAHKGFYFPFTFGILGIFLGRTRRQTVLFAGFLAVYLLYIAWIDGFLMLFAGDARGRGGKNYPEMLVAMGLLGTSVIGSALRQVSDGIHLTALRCALFVAGIAMGIDALRRIVLFRDARFVSAAAFLWPALGMIATTVVGRFEMAGWRIEEGERYWYNSVLFLLGMLCYTAVLRPRLPLIVATTVVGSAAAILVSVSFTYMPHYIRYWYNENCIQLGRAMNPETQWEYGGYLGPTLEGFQTSREFLRKHKADVFSFPALAVLDALPSPTSASASLRVEGAFDERGEDVHSTAGVLSNQYPDVRMKRSRVAMGREAADLLMTEVPRALNADIGVIWQAGRPIAVGYVLDLEGVQSAMHYAPSIADDARLVLYKSCGRDRFVVVGDWPVKVSSP